MILAIVIFAITLVLIIARPKPLNEGTAAALGAIAIVATGVVSPRDAFDVLKATDNILLFFLGLMVICTITDQAGFFKWCAHKAVRLAKGSARRLLLVVFGLGVLITAFFSNDATALILTPIVFVLITRFKLKPSALRLCLRLHRQHRLHAPAGVEPREPAGRGQLRDNSG